jgi:pimeloyl-ACP methyl ester carboxylesterase
MFALERLRTGYQQRRMFLPAEPDEPSTHPQAFGLPAEDHWLTAEDNVRLHGWWIPHPRPRATLLFCHGNTGNLGNYLGVFRYLRRLRVNIFGFDYRGYGRSTGRPSEMGLYRDARAAWDHLRGTLGVARQDILVLGHSLGGAIAIDLAAERPVGALIVQSSFTDMRAMARHLFSPVHLIAKNGFRNIDKVAQLAMPKLFVHGEADPKIPLEMGRALFEAAAEPKAWFTVPGAGHNDVHRHGGPPYLRVLRDFLDERGR